MVVNLKLLEDLSIREAKLCKELLAGEVMLIGLELDEVLRSGPPP